MIGKLTIEKLDKERLGVIFAILLVFLIAGLIFYFSEIKKPPSPAEIKAEDIVKKQLEEIEKLREQMGPQFLSVEQIESQSKELEKYRKKSPLASPEQIQSQLEELEKLRSQQ